uniref:Peptidylprolyl isomerase E n=1 Tax=Malurus cyaneus samueli TaxID=2593467 RepID=A0A8C5UCN9_9PASS
MAATKRVLYVGGLAEEVDEKVLHAAFIPFGDITDIQIPLDYETEKHRGFAFVEFELAENESELFGRTIRVNLAKPMRIKEGSSRPVWSDDEWLKKFRTLEENKEEEGGEAPKAEAQERISAVSAPTRKGLASKAAASTGSSPSSCARLGISPTTTAPVANPSMARNLMMKTSFSSTQGQGWCPWPIPAPTPTAPSSSSLVTRQTGWMENMWCWGGD